MAGSGAGEPTLRRVRFPAMATTVCSGLRKSWTTASQAGPTVATIASATRASNAKTFPSWSCGNIAPTSSPVPVRPPGSAERGLKPLADDLLVALAQGVGDDDQRIVVGMQHDGRRPGAELGGDLARRPAGAGREADVQTVDRARLERVVHREVHRGEGQP